METNQLSTLVEKGLALVRIENENAQMIAIQRPRDEEKVRERALKELERSPDFAARAFYVIPYKDRSEGGEKTVEVKGLSIHASRALARLWGNLSVRVRIADDARDEIVLEGAVIDLETNFRDSKDRKVSKNRYDKGTKQMVPLREDRLLMAMESASSKLERNLLLAVMPIAMKDEYFQAAMSIASGGAVKGKRGPKLSERLKAMFAKFSEIEIAREVILKYLKIDDEKKINEEMVGRMVGIFNAINDKETTKEEAFGVGGTSEGDARDDRAKNTVDALLNEKKEDTTGGGQGGDPPKDVAATTAGDASKDSKEYQILSKMIGTMKSLKGVPTMMNRIKESTHSNTLTQDEAGRLTSLLDDREKYLRENPIK